MRRPILLLLVAVIGAFTALTSSLALVPRVRPVEIVTIFFSAFASGASLVSAVVELRRGRSGRR